MLETGTCSAFQAACNIAASLIPRLSDQNLRAQLRRPMDMMSQGWSMSFPVVAAVVDDGVVGPEDVVGQPVVAHELPDVLLRVQLRALRRECDDGDGVRRHEASRQVPSCLGDQQSGMVARLHLGGDGRKMQRHRLGVTPGQDQARAFAIFGADSAKDGGGRGALIFRRRWSGAAPRPAPGDLVLLANPGLVGKPYFYGVGCDAFLPCDLVQTGGETFLKASIAPLAWA